MALVVALVWTPASLLMLAVGVGSKAHAETKSAAIEGGARASGSRSGPFFWAPRNVRTLLAAQRALKPLAGPVAGLRERFIVIREVARMTEALGTTATGGSPGPGTTVRADFVVWLRSAVAALARTAPSELQLLKAKDRLFADDLRQHVPLVTLFEALAARAANRSWVALGALLAVTYVLPAALTQALAAGGGAAMLAFGPMRQSTGEGSGQTASERPPDTSARPSTRLAPLRVVLASFSNLGFGENLRAFRTEHPRVWYGTGALLLGALVLPAAAVVTTTQLVTGVTSVVMMGLHLHYAARASAVQTAATLGLGMLVATRPSNGMRVADDALEDARHLASKLPPEQERAGLLAWAAATLGEAREWGVKASPDPASSPDAMPLTLLREAPNGALALALGLPNAEAVRRMILGVVFRRSSIVSRPAATPDR